MCTWCAFIFKNREFDCEFGGVEKSLNIIAITLKVSKINSL